MILLRDDRARLEVHPDVGAAIGRYDFEAANGDPLPIFQTAPAPGRRGPFALGLNLLIPFSNRISGGGFWHEGVFHPLERNAADRYPIHGNAFTMPWTVREAAPDTVSLTLASEGPGAFRYDAEIRYRLIDGALSMRLTVVNRAAIRLPFGAGFHPWFVRDSETRLTMTARGYWTETDDHLPGEYRPTVGDDRFDFADGRAPPATFVNNALTGWDGRATITWLDRGIAVEISAPPPLTTVILYSPSAAADFICVEPVSHSVDAHNRSAPGTTAPQALAAGDELVIETTIRPFTL